MLRKAIHYVFSYKGVVSNGKIVRDYREFLNAIKNKVKTGFFFLNKDSIFRFYGVDYFVPRYDTSAFSVNYGKENAVLTYIDNLIDKNEKSLYIDIGANIGSTFLPIVKKYEEVKGIAFEPVSHLSNAIKESILINNIEGAEVYNIALSDSKEKDITINYFKYQNALITTVGGINPNKKWFKYESISERVKNSNLDKFIEKSKDRDKVIIKIDVEGSELSVLKGGENMIKKCNPIIIFESWDNKKEEPTRRFLEELGYKEFKKIDSINTAAFPHR